MTPCPPHHWIITPTDQVEDPSAGLPGTCKRCGASALFPPPWAEYETSAQQWERGMNKRGRLSRGLLIALRERDIEEAEAKAGTGRHAEPAPLARPHPRPLSWDGDA